MTGVSSHAKWQHIRNKFRGLWTLFFNQWYNRQSAIGNRQSAIGNRQSAIGNRQSAIGKIKFCYNIFKKSADNQYIKSFRRLARALMTAAMACAAWGTAPAHAAISITETDADSFRYTTAPGWDFYGSQRDPVTNITSIRPLELTASSPGSDGWLRLTEVAQYQNASATYKTPFLPEEGLEIIFDYATYDGSSSTGADNIGFILRDGLSGTGYVSIYLNEFGGLSTQTHSPSGTCYVPCGHKPQSVVVRGASSVNRPLLESVQLSTGAFATTLGKISPVTPAAARTVRITISPASSAVPPTVTVEINPNDGTGFVKVIDALELTVAQNGLVPTTFKLAFEGYTGYETNKHEVRIKSARTLKALALPVPTLGQSTLGVLAVLLALLTLPTLRSRFKN
ncbi:MAG: hypothetical protein LBP52_06025 [Burkholderiaceae bacterium]|nr:hypothetical protein [Burkholderiaceae bacterium]